MKIAGYDVTSGTFDNYENYEKWINNGMPPIFKPNGLRPIYENIPNELKNRNNWIIWEYLMREVSNPPKEGNIRLWTKKPHGYVNDASTWISFDEVVKRYENGDGDGIGFVFKKDGGLVGIDLDNVIDSEGNVSRLSYSMVSKAKSFTELSPSKRGLHLY